MKLARFATCLLLMLVFVPLAFAASSRYQTIFVDQVSEIIPYWKLNAQVDGLMVARAGETGELGLSIVAGFDFDAMDVKEPPSYESIKAAPLKDVKSFGLSEEAMARFALPKSEGGFADGFKHPDEFSLDGLEVSPENAWTHRVAFSVKPDYPLDEYYSEFDDVERVYVPRQYCEMEGVGVEMHPAGWESENKEFFLSGSPTKLSFALEDERRGCTKAEATICARDSKYCYKKDLHETFDSNKHCVDCYLD